MYVYVGTSVLCVYLNAHMVHVCKFSVSPINA